jgi:CHAD domain-containing protein
LCRSYLIVLEFRLANDYRFRYHTYLRHDCAKTNCTNVLQCVVPQCRLDGNARGVCIPRNFQQHHFEINTYIPTYNEWHKYSIVIKLMVFLSISSKHFRSRLEANVQRVDKRLNDYLKDPNENNIHDIRTAIRRVDASFGSLPKKERSKNHIHDYITIAKRLFKINSQIRDYDIINTKLEKYSSDTAYDQLTESLKRRRKTKLANAIKIATSLRQLPVPYFTENDIVEKKLSRRYNKLVRRLSERIELNFPVVLTNMNKIIELHEMRKDCKKLRYQLELMPDHNNNDSIDDNEIHKMITELEDIQDMLGSIHIQNNKETHKMITELEDIQDMLGSIHDSDTMIAYLKRVRRSKDITHILDNEITERNTKYGEFVQFCKRNLSSSRNNFFNQICLLA